MIDFVPDDPELTAAWLRACQLQLSGQWRAAASAWRLLSKWVERDAPRDALVYLGLAYQAERLAWSAP